MKATMKGDQTFPVRAISKDALNRKETGARTPGTRFDDVLSGLAEARNSSAKTTTHRVSESATRLTIGRSADSLQPRSSEDVDSILSDGEAADSAVPKDALHQHEATGSQHFRLPSEQILPQPQAAMVLSSADSPGPGIEGSLATRVRKDGDVRLDPGGQTHPADMPAGRLTERSVAGARPVTEAAIRLDIPPKHPIAFLTAQSSDLGRAPIAGANQTIQTERAGLAPGRIPSRVLGESLSVLGNEKHFQPVARAAIAPAADARVQSTVSVVSAPRLQTGRATAQDSVQPPAERSSPPADRSAPPADRSAPPASRTEPQVISASSPASVVLQLGGAIAQEIESAGAAPLAPAAGPSLVVRQPVGHEPLRILKVALEPAELGYVTVHLRLTGETLELRVTADRAETASMLERDRHLLSRILEMSGYSASDVTVQPATSALQPGPLAMRAAPETQAGAQAAPEFHSNGSADGERHPSRSQDGHGHSRQKAERDEQDLDPRSRGDLYV